MLIQLTNNKSFIQLRSTESEKTWTLTKCRIYNISVIMLCLIVS